MSGTALLEQHEKGFWMVDFWDIGPTDWRDTEELGPPDSFMTNPSREACIDYARAKHPYHTLFELGGDGCECEPEDECENEVCGMYWTEVKPQAGEEEERMKFNKEMEKAVLNGTKTQTRRLMKPQPVHVDGGFFWPERKPFKFAWSDDVPGASFDEAGECEACPHGAIGHHFTVDGQSFEITGIRTERVQAISIEDCKAEGISSASPFDNYGKIDFAKLWESIYPGSWERNEWVWVIEFNQAGKEKS